MIMYGRGGRAGIIIITQKIFGGCKMEIMNDECYVQNDDLLVELPKGS